MLGGGLLSGACPGRQPAGSRYRPFQVCPDDGRQQKEEIVDYLKMTAPCGLDCFNCHFWLARENEDSMNILKGWSEQYDVPLEVMFCDGCKAQDGRIPLQGHVFGEEHRCAAFECAKEKGHALCSDCGDFPCDHLHPYSDRATDLPHNMKVFNLCLIRKMGLEKWAEEKAAKVRETYFTHPWDLSRAPE